MPVNDSSRRWTAAVGRREMGDTGDVPNPPGENEKYGEAPTAFKIPLLPPTEVRARVIEAAPLPDP